LELGMHPYRVHPTRHKAQCQRGWHLGLSNNNPPLAYAARPAGAGVPCRRGPLPQTPPQPHCRAEAQAAGHKQQAHSFSACKAAVGRVHSVLSAAGDNDDVLHSPTWWSECVFVFNHRQCCTLNQGCGFYSYSKM